MKKFWPFDGTSSFFPTLMTFLRPFFVTNMKSNYMFLMVLNQFLGSMELFDKRILAHYGHADYLIQTNYFILSIFYIVNILYCQYFILSIFYIVNICIKIHIFKVARSVSGVGVTLKQKFLAFWGHNLFFHILCYHLISYFTCYQVYTVNSGKYLGMLNW